METALLIAHSLQGKSITNGTNSSKPSPGSTKFVKVVVEPLWKQEEFT
jgi:hypothetical protein